MVKGQSAQIDSPESGRIFIEMLIMFFLPYIIFLSCAVNAAVIRQISAVWDELFLLLVKY